MTSHENPRTKPLLQYVENRLAGNVTELEGLKTTVQTILTDLGRDIPDALSRGTVISEGVDVSNDISINDSYTKVITDLVLAAGTYLIQGAITVSNSASATAQIELSIVTFNTTGSVFPIETAYRSIIGSSKETVHVSLLVTFNSQTTFSLQPKLEVGVGGVTILNPSKVRFYAQPLRL